jgi:HNH endonuclease
MRVPEAERFWAKVNLLAPNGCWEWLPGAGSNGYGKFILEPEAVGKDGKTVSAHRWAYEYLVGPIPFGLTLDHTCENTICVNVSHLEPVTQGDNNRRYLDRRTVCKRGHEYLGRRCDTCRKAYMRDYMKTRRAEMAK